MARYSLPGFSSGLGLLSALCVVPPITLANPEGGQVAAGVASIQQTSPSRVDVVQGSDRAVIDWQGFSIDHGEHTNFQQPSSSAVALNRVRGADPSRIDGRLSANGNVYLVNRNGVVFGAGAKVDVAGLVATTADISNENFMQGRDVFDRPSDNPDAEVVNRGRIEVDEGGAVVLAAPRVSNEGEIKARLGRVALAGAETFTVDFHGDGLLQFDMGSEVKQASSDGESGEALVSNTGTIIADGGVVEMSARTQDAVVEQVINMDGVVQARSVASVGGKIILSGGEEGIVAVSGKLDASGPEAGQTGGEVKVLGEKVGLFAGAEIDASGDAGGGEVLVGGNFQGQGPETNAARTYVDEQASIKADANNEGDGGTVVVWSDEVTDYRGEISARGGENGGDGGFVEVSGKQALGFEGDVSVGADHGDTGTVLLDPEEITISDTGGGDGNGGGGGDLEVEDDATIAFADGDSANFNFQISDEALEGLEGNIVLQAFEDIFVDESLELTNQEAGESVVFQAGRDIDIAANITTNGAGLHLEADSPHSVGFDGLPQGAADGDGMITVGNLDFPDVVISTNGGDISLISSGIDISDTSLVDAGSGAIQIAQSENGIDFQFGDDEFGDGVLNADKLARIRTTGVTTFGQATTAGTDGLGTGALPLVAGSITVIEPFTASGPITQFVSEFGILLEAPLSGSGELILQPGDPATPIDVGLQTSGFDLTQQELANLSNGFSQITIGHPDGAHTITINQASFSDPVVFRYPDGGGATVNSTGQAAGLSGSDDASFSFQGSGATLNLNANIVTSGSPILIEDSVLLGADVVFDTTDGDALGANISIAGTTNGTNALTLTAGTGAINLGNVGDTAPLTGLTASGATLGLQDVATQGSQDYTGNVTFNSSYVTNGGNFTVNGDAVIASATDITTGGGSVTFGGALNGTNPLTIIAGNAGNISFNGDVGLVNALQTINVTSGQDVRLNGRFVAGDTRLVYSGAASSVNGSLGVSNLFLDPGATSATVFGTVAGASGTDAALTVTGPVDNPAFTINGCVIGVSCVASIPPTVDPITPQLAQSGRGENLIKGAAATSTPNTPTPPMWAVNIRRPPSADPTTPQYSNFGNEELWNRRRDESDEECDASERDDARCQPRG